MKSQLLPYNPPTAVGLLLFTLLMTGALLSACDSAGGGGSGVEGTYSVVSMSIDNQSVPPEVIEDSQLTLEGDETWDGVLEVNDPDRVISGEGEYTLSDGNVIFTLDESNVEGDDKVVGITGSINDSRLEVTLRSGAGGADAEVVFEKN